MKEKEKLVYIYSLNLLTGEKIRTHAACEWLFTFQINVCRIKEGGGDGGVKEDGDERRREHLSDQGDGGIG